MLFESQESSSPIITRTIANFYNRKYTEIYQFSKIERAALKIIGLFPPKLAEWIIPRANSTNSLDYHSVWNLKTTDLIAGRIIDYKNISKKMSAITIGIGMGGTTSHLALALGGTFLPQAFVITLKNGTMTGNVNEYYKLSSSLVHHITNQNPDLMTIQHYDPIHDGWLVKRVNHLRMKLIELPEEYKRYIKDNVLPGGDVVYLEGNAKWKRFRTGERNVFQVGGWGDISADEFIYGSKRLTDYAKKEKLHYDHWMLTDYPIEIGPESEWGSEAGLGEALEDFCKKEGFHFIKISFEDPNDFSRLAFEMKLKMLNKLGKDPSGVVIEMFSQFDTDIIDRSTLVPLWLIFNTMDSLRFLEQMKDQFPKDKPIFFSGLSTFSITPDLVPWDNWENILKDFEMINIGVRKNHYPADPHVLLDWKKPLQRWQYENPEEMIDSKITGNELLELSQLIKNDKINLKRNI